MVLNQTTQSSPELFSNIFKTTKTTAGDTLLRLYILCLIRDDSGFLRTCRHIQILPSSSSYYKIVFK